MVVKLSKRKIQVCCVLHSHKAAGSWQAITFLLIEVGSKSKKAFKFVFHSVAHASPNCIVTSWQHLHLIHTFQCFHWGCGHGRADTMCCLPFVISRFRLSQIIKRVAVTAMILWLCAQRWAHTNQDSSSLRCSHCTPPFRMLAVALF